MDLNQNLQYIDIYIYTKAILGSAVPGISGYITYNHIKLRAPYPNLWGFCHHGLAHLYRQLHPFLFQPPFRHEGLPTCKSPDFCAVNLISPCHVWLPKAISYSSLHPYLPSSKRRQMWNTHHLQMMFLGNPWVFHIFCVHPRGFYAAILGSTVHGGFFTCEVHCQRTQFSSNTLQLGENTWLQWCPCSVLFHGEFLQRMSTLDQ